MKAFLVILMATLIGAASGLFIHHAAEADLRGSTEIDRRDFGSSLGTGAPRIDPPPAPKAKPEPARPGPCGPRRR